MRLLLIPLALLPVMLGGCSLLTTTADGIAAIGEGITQSTASSSDATTTEGEDSPAVEQARIFSHSHYAQLRRDAAVGQGESLAALGTLLGPEMALSDQQAFSRWMQANYAALFFNEPDEALVDRILALRKQDSTQARL